MLGTDEWAAPPGATIVTPADLAIPDADVAHLRIAHSEWEVAAALVPWLVLHVLEREASVIFVEACSYVTGTLDPLSDAAQEHSFALVPTCADPGMWHDSLPFGNDLAWRGPFDAGLFAAGHEGRGGLEWWGERSLRMRRAATDALTYIPSMFQHEVISDPGIGAGHWNLAGRTITGDVSAPLVDQHPLRLLRMQNFDPDQEYLLTLDHGDLPTVLLSDQPVLREVVGRYSDELRSAGWQPGEDGGGLLQTQLTEHLRLDDVMRRTYIKQLHHADRDPRVGGPPPFLSSGDIESFINWLRAPADWPGASGRLSRYLQNVWDERPDLQAAYPSVGGPDYSNFLLWASTHGVSELGLQPDLIPVDDAGGDKIDFEVGRPEQLVPGVRAVGLFSAELGLGEAARAVVTGLERTDIPFATVTYRPNIPCGMDHPFEERGADPAAFDTNLLCVNINLMDGFVREAGPDFFRDRYTIGQWFWEVTDVPDDIVPAFDSVDEVWVACEYVAQTFRRYTDKPVLAMPMVVEPPSHEPVTREQLELPDGFMFFFMFDHNSVIERKNPMAVVEAFCRAFQPGEGPVLVIKSHKGDVRRKGMERLRDATRGRDDIVLIDGFVPAWKKHGLAASCDCYVSLHRSEGYGLTMAEAMTLGKPVIATRYSGNLAFMNDEVSYLVDYDLTTVPPGCEPYPAGSEWADPDLDHAALLMRQVYDDQEAARQRGELGRRFVEEHLSADAAADFMRMRLAEIRANRSREQQSPAPDVELPPLTPPPPSHAARVRGFVNMVSGTDRRSPLGGLKRRVRRFGSTRRQRAFEDAVATTLESVERARIEVEEQLHDATAATHALGDALRATNAKLERTMQHQTDRFVHMDELRQVAVRQIARDVHAEHARTTALIEALNPPLGLQEAFGFEVDRSGGGEVIGFRGNAEVVPPSEQYRAFEDVFRGTESAIRGRQQQYVQMLREHGPVLDVGCGRGELLELARDANIAATGVDLDPAMVARCEEKGLAATCANALDHLAELPPASLGAIFSAQLIEHLTHTELVQFVALSHRALRPGGILVAETVNPHSLVARKAFWLDRTHVCPVFPEVALTLCRNAGFDAAHVHFPGGCGRLADDRQTCGDFAVVATR